MNTKQNKAYDDGYVEITVEEIRPGRWRGHIVRDQDIIRGMIQETYFNTDMLEFLLEAVSYGGGIVHYIDYGSNKRGE